MNFLKFPDIEGFHNVVKAIGAYPHLAPEGKMTYRGKIKLHGTNAGIRIKNGEIAAQSRTQIITPESDNAGFARWVESTRDFWKTVEANNPESDITIFGEWCGPGIMKKTAINLIPHKVFAIFAIITGGDDESIVIAEPDEIADFLIDRPKDVKVLPWYGESFIADFTNKELLQETANSLNAEVERIEPCDPWVKSEFNIEGIAEGIVFYPTVNTRKRFSDLVFKAKGQQHKVVKSDKSVQVDPEIAASVAEFVDMFVTEPRLEQGLGAVGGSFEMKNIGPFLKWMGQDVLKESSDELEASGLEWEQVQKSVQAAARNWFINKNKSLA